jgi:hypothetical protein
MDRSEQLANLVREMVAEGTDPQPIVAVWQEALRIAGEWKQADPLDVDARLCLGWLRLDRPGDLPPGEVVCLDCGGTCDAGVWLAVLSGEGADCSLQGPYCDLCATSE